MLANAYNDDDELNITLDDSDDEVISNVLKLDEDNCGDTADSDSNVDDAGHLENGANFVASCHNMACAHVQTHFKHSFSTELNAKIQPVTNATAAMKQRYSEHTFRGLLADYDCSYLSTGGVSQYLAYCTKTGLSPEINTSQRAFIGFANIRHTSSRNSHNQWLTCNIHLHPFYLPFLLSLQDMDRLGIYIDNLSNEVVHKNTNGRAEVTRQWVHAFITWNHFILCHITEQELRNLHRRFGHHSVQKVNNVLKRATANKMGKHTYRILRQIQKHCKYFQKFCVKPSDSNSLLEMIR